MWNVRRLYLSPFHRTLLSSLEILHSSYWITYSKVCSLQSKMATRFLSHLHFGYGALPRAKSQNLTVFSHTRKNGTVCQRGCLPHQATWLALFAFLINYSLILAYHLITSLFSTNSATVLMPSDVIYSSHHHALSNKNILKSWPLSTVQISWFVYHLVSLAKFTHTTEANILL